MFNFSFQKRNGEIVELINAINEDENKLKISEYAMEKAVAMIAKAIAKSEIVLQDKNGRRKDEYYYALNVRPNDYETGTDFWNRVVRRLLIKGECLVIPVKGKYYIADNWNENDQVLKPVIYSNIQVSRQNHTIRLNRTYKAGEVMHMRYCNYKVKQMLNRLAATYDDLATKAKTAYASAAMQKYKLDIDASVRLVEQKSDGSQAMVTREQYLQRITDMLSNPKTVVVSTPKGINLEPLNAQNKADIGDMEKIKAGIYEDVAMAFDIPVAVFKGTITEKSDATNEFMTYAVSPVAEVINDSMNATLIGEEDYISGERCFVWLAKFKHVDVIESANNLDKLRAIGFTLDEIFDLCGYPQLETDFSTERVVTKNYGKDSNNA
jgi:HK97 family phage portal protein